MKHSSKLLKDCLHIQYICKSYVKWQEKTLDYLGEITLANDIYMHTNKISMLKLKISDVHYKIFCILPITIIAHQIYHGTIIITICN